MKSIPLEERFWSKVNKTDNANGCWEWQAGRFGGGYGKIAVKHNGKWTGLYAHRVSYELTHGPIPDGMCVCHSCDNPKCVNPSHLWIGTQIENIKDRDIKGRLVHGVPTPEFRQRMSEIAKSVGRFTHAARAQWTEEQREQYETRRKEGVIRRWQDPEQHRQQSESAKARYARKKVRE